MQTAPAGWIARGDGVVSPAAFVSAVTLSSLCMTLF
jgi:hypothetical protein